MKIKNKKWAIAGIFMSLFFFTVSSAKADDCSNCQASGETDCSYYCATPIGDNGSSDYVNNNDPAIDCRASGGTWDYSIGSCGWTTQNNEEYTYNQCKSDGGDEAYCGQFPGASTESQNLNYMSDGTCSKDADCGAGFECYQQSCVDNQSYSNDVAWYSRAWEGTTDFFTGSYNTPDSAGSSVFKTNGTINIPGIGSVPAGSTVSSTGVVTSPDGRELGYVSTGTINDLAAASSISQFGNGGFNGGLNGGNGNGGFPGGNGNIGTTGPKCGTSGQFVEVGGVCFPSSNVTHLSDASVMDILISLFSWLMGIFSILALAAFVLSGVMYFLSSADADLAKRAKTNAVNALIGIIIGLSGFIIVQAIGTALSGRTNIF